jgi:tRNA A-37 threonylcarbamoyl transferase component Bud32
MSDPATDEPSQAIVMELLEGPTLEKRLQGSAFSRLDVVSIGSDLISGVAEYHRRRMAHFDLHGGNVILAAPNAKLVDPLFHDTAILGRTGALGGQQDRDLRDLRHLLGSILRHSDILLEATGEFERRTYGGERAHFGHPSKRIQSRDGQACFAVICDANRR